MEFKLTTVAKNDFCEIKATTGLNFVLYKNGLMVAHLCPVELEALRALLSVPLLPGE